MQCNLNTIWYEKYRPNSLEEMVLTDELRQKVSEWISNKDIPHILFSGVRGIGKTSLAKILANAIAGKEDYIYLNGSEMGIDDIRLEVNDFLKVRSFNGGLKIVLLDELDGIGGGTSDAAQDALRNVIESNVETGRFIATCNNLNKVTLALQSRFSHYDTTPPLNGYAKRSLHILKAEKIQLDADNLDKVKTLAKIYYPDMRNLLNELQKKVFNGKLQLTDITGIGLDHAQELLAAISKKESDHAIRKILIEGKKKFDGNYSIFYKNLFEGIYNSNWNEDLIRTSLVVVGDYFWKNSTIIDPEINAYCCLLSIKNLMHP